MGTRRILQALDLARDSEDSEPFVSGLAAWWIQWVRPELSLPLGRRAVEGAEEIGAANVVGIAYQGLGRALLANGQAGEAVEAIRTSLERGSRFQQLPGRPALVLALVRAGRVDEALELAPKVLTTMQEAGSRYTEIEAHLGYGEALLAARGLDAAGEIEQHADAAMRLIDETGFGMFYHSAAELRARLCERRGDRDAAARHLREAQTYCAERGAEAEAARLGARLAAL